MKQELIRELMKQAGELAYEEHKAKCHKEGLDPEYTVWSVTGETYEKFAELIVKECVEQIVAKGTDWVDFAPSQTGVRPEYWDMAQQIKEHFGVEE